MTSLTPSNRDRLERHLQRQRGAGARNLVTSFGFAFGLPSAPLPTPSNKPAKNRQTFESLSPRQQGTTAAAFERSDCPTRDDDDEAGINSKRANIENQQHPHKRNRTDDIEREKDTLPVKKRGRPREAVACSAAEALKGPRSNTSAKPATSSGAKRVVRRATNALASNQLPAGGDTIGVTSVQSDTNEPQEDQQEPVVRKRGRPRKVDVITITKIDPCGTLGVQPDVDAAQTNQQQPAAKRKGRPQKVDVATSRNTECSNDALERLMLPRATQEDVDEEQLPIQKAPRQPKSYKLAHFGDKASVRNTKTASANCSVGAELDNDLCKQDALTSARPRRRAAAAAMIKVAEDLVEENEPIDKKRRPEQEARKKNLSRPPGNDLPSTTKNSIASGAPSVGLATLTPPRLVDTAKVSKRNREPSKRDYQTIANQLERTALAELRINLPPRSASPRKDDAECIPGFLKRSVSILDERGDKLISATLQEPQKAARNSKQTKRDTPPARQDTATMQWGSAALDVQRIAHPQEAISADIDGARNCKERPLPNGSSSAAATAATSKRVKRGTGVQPKSALAQFDDGEDLEGPARNGSLAWGDVGIRQRVELKKDKSTSQEPWPPKASRRPLRPCPAEVDLDDLLSDIADMAAARLQTRLKM